VIKVKRETVFQQRYNLKVLIIYSVLLRAEEVDKVLITLKLWDGSYTKYI